MKIIYTSIIFFISLSISLAQTTITGKVVRVADGDSFTMLNGDNKQIRIRLHGIDCPEYKQDFSQVAKKFTSDAVYGKVVKVEILDTDRYGRTIGMVTTPKGTVLNKELLKAGLAWHYKHFDKTEEFSELEREAKENKIGIWSHQYPIPPWEFRKQKSR